MPGFMPLFLFVAGLCAGSFMNVAVLRSGFSERGSARSHCPSCGAPLRWYDLVPVVSYVALRGRCRSCGSAISIQYPLVELSVGALFLFSYLAAPPVAAFWSLAAFCALLVFLALLVALVAYDLRHTLVPLSFTVPLGAAAAAAAAFQSAYAGSLAPLMDSIEGGAALFVFFFAISVMTRGRGMGTGDAYVAGAIGLLLGFFRGIEAIMIGIWAGTAVAIIALLLSSLARRTRLFPRAPRVTMKTELPLVPFLAFGAAAALVTDFSPIAAAAFLSSMLVARL